MPIPVTVPRLGWSMEEGIFLGWLKQEGDVVSPGEPLFAIEGDKASQEIEATDGGRLHVAPGGPKAGDTVRVGTVLAYLLAGNESVAPAGGSLGPATASPGPTPDTTPAVACPEAVPAAAPVGSRAGQADAAVAASPRARRRAAELGVDYRRLKGSGRTGRVVEADVLAAAARMETAGPSLMRRTIARRTAESFARAPHFYLMVEVDATSLVERREGLLAAVEAGAGVRLTLTDLLLRAQALALRDCPRANAFWQEDRVVAVAGCDIGLVVGLVDGLLVPVLRGADAGGLAALARQRRSLVDAARAGQLGPEATQGGATSLSNLGHTRVDQFAAVIAPPQSSMLAVGWAAPRPFVSEGRLTVRTTLNLCLSVDHRVMDGGPAAEFLGRIVDLIERPDPWAHA